MSSIEALIQKSPTAHKAVFYCLEKSMGAARKIDVYGAKGGSEKPKTPTEAPDSLRSVAIAKMLIAVGEGEFDGAPNQHCADHRRSCPGERRNHVKLLRGSGPGDQHHEHVMARSEGSTSELGIGVPLVE
jgi:hypothetical protein